MRRMNEAAAGERFGGSGGGDLEEAMWNSAEICYGATESELALEGRVMVSRESRACEVKCDQGGLAVSISTIVQPSDHTSAGRP